MNTNIQSLYEILNLNITVNVFYPFISTHCYLSAYLIVSFTAHSPQLWNLSFITWADPVTSIRSLRQQTWTPVTNHVFHCTLPFSLIMSNRAQNTPPHHHHLETLCWENDYYSRCTFLCHTTKHCSIEGRNIWLLVICNYNLEWSKSAFDCK